MLALLAQQLPELYDLSCFHHSSVSPCTDLTKHLQNLISNQFVILSVAVVNVIIRFNKVCDVIAGPQHEGHGHPEERPRIRTEEEVQTRDEGRRASTGKCSSALLSNYHLI